MGECDMGCQPDWHRDECAIYLPDAPVTPAVPDPTVEALSEAWNKGWAARCDADMGDEVRNPYRAARAAAPDALRVRVEALTAERERLALVLHGTDYAHIHAQTARDLRALLEDGAR